MRWLDRNGRPTDAWPGIRGVAYLSDSAAAALFEGAPQSLDQVLDAAEAGKPAAFDLPVRATMRTVSVHERVESPNVAARKRVFWAATTSPSTPRCQWNGSWPT